MSCIPLFSRRDAGRPCLDDGLTHSGQTCPAVRSQNASEAQCSGELSASSASVGYHSRETKASNATLRYGGANDEDDVVRDHSAASVAQ